MILLHLIVTLVVTERPLAHAVCGTAVFPFLLMLNYEAGRNLNIFVLEYCIIFPFKPNLFEFYLTVEYHNYSKFH